MRYIVRNRLLWALGAASAVFVGASAVLSAYDLIEITKVALILTSLSLIGVYAPLWWPAMRYGKLDGANRLGAGIGLLALSILCHTVYSYLWRIMGFPPWMTAHPMVAYWPMIGVFGCLLLILVPSNDDDTIQTRSWLIVAAVGFLVGVASGAIFVTKWGDIFGEIAIPKAVAEKIDRICDDQKPVFVRAYRRSDGTHVYAHCRGLPGD